MSADPRENNPAVRPVEAQEIDFEVVDDGTGSGTNAVEGAGGGPALHDFARQMQMAPEMLVRAFRQMLKEKLKKWAVRSLIWGGVLGLLATEHTWAKWAFGFWLFFAGAHLAFLLYGWYASGKAGSRIMQAFGAMMPPRGQP